MAKRKKHREFRPGDEVEVIESDERRTWGYTATVVDVRRGMVIVDSPFAGGTVAVPESQVVRA